MSIDQYPFKTIPFDHQLNELRNNYDKQKWALFWEMGTGKSKVIIDNIGLLYLEGKIDTAVIEAKKGEYANWYYDLIPTHMPDSIPHEVFLFSSYSSLLAEGKRRAKSIMMTEPRRLRIFVVNVESVGSSDRARKLLAEFYKSTKAVFFVVDESTCVKHPKSKRSKATVEWSHKSHYRRIMTGSPVTESPLDLWGQGLVLGTGLFGTRSFTAFRGEYCEMEDTWINRGGAMVSFPTIVGYKNIDKLSKYLDLFSSRLMKKDCLDLPDKIYKRQVIEMTEAQGKLYRQLRDEALAEIEGQQIEVVNALALVTKLHQIACGQLKVDEDKYISIENNRLDALVEILEDYPGKVIIWATYRQTLKDVIATLKEKFGEESTAGYYGGTSDEDRRIAVKDFQDPNSKLKYFVANPQSAGYGLTLTQAHLVIYYSNGYNLEHRLQSEDRAHRIGQTEKVTYIDFVSPGTIDERILDVLREKRSLAHEIMTGNGLKDWL